MLWRSEDFAKALSLTACSVDANDVVIDTRDVTPGVLFAALKGDRLDGHDFVQQALEAGAAGVVVSRLDPAWPKEKCLLVDDTLKALWDLGVYARARTKAQIIGVTGSMGKTTTKEGLVLALQAQAKTHHSQKSYNNHWGVPLTLAKMPLDTEVAILEMGMSAAGEMRALSHLVRPHVCIVTGIAPVHLEFFDSVEAIARAKAEIFEGAEPGGIAVLDRDQEEFFDLLLSLAHKHNLNVLAVGEHKEAVIRLESWEPTEQGSLIGVKEPHGSLRYFIHNRGFHLVKNSLAVLGAVVAVGKDPGRAARDLAMIGGLSGRGAVAELLIEGKKITLLDESYNANPVAMRAAMKVLKSYPGRHIAILADMRELGAESPKLHAELREPLEDAHVEAAFLYGPFMQNLHEALKTTNISSHHFEDRKDLFEALLPQLKEGDVLLVKGSNGCKLSEIVEQLKTSSIGGR